MVSKQLRLIVKDLVVYYLDLNFLSIISKYHENPTARIEPGASGVLRNIAIHYTKWAPLQDKYL